MQPEGSRKLRSGMLMRSCMRFLKRLTSVVGYKELYVVPCCPAGCQFEESA